MKLFALMLSQAFPVKLYSDFDLKTRGEELSYVVCRNLERKIYLY